MRGGTGPRGATVPGALNPLMRVPGLPAVMGRLRSLWVLLEPRMIRGVNYKINGGAAKTALGRLANLRDELISWSHFLPGWLDSDYSLRQAPIARIRAWIGTTRLYIGTLHKPASLVA